MIKNIHVLYYYYYSLKSCRLYIIIIIIIIIIVIIIISFRFKSMDMFYNKPLFTFSSFKLWKKKSKKTIFILPR